MPFCKNCGKELIGTPEYCPQCGARPYAANSYCPNCGAAITPMTEICVKCGGRVSGPKVASTTPVTPAAGVSPKSRMVTTLLAFFLGTLGIHRFYLGKIGTAVVMLILTIIGWATFIFIVGWFFLAAAGIWAFIDFIMAAIGSMKDKDGLPVKN